jgi:GPH family glycoside/pentoside/hexuronide:cation symporter
MDKAAIPSLSRWTKLGYAYGNVAGSVGERGLSAFLLIFYNQVIGLPAYMVASVLLVTTMIDAVLDPTVGYFSDHFNSRWGRRHPFIYASAVPISVAYLLIWNPPDGWSNEAVAAYVLSAVLVMRIFQSFFEVPSAALLPELTQNYDERTGIISLRMLFGMLGGMVMTVLAYRVFLREDTSGTGGILARHGYSSYGLASALVIATAILLSGMSTQSRIPYLSKPTVHAPTLRAMLREVGATLNNRSYIALIAAGMMMSISIGAKTALEVYFQLYYWVLTQAQLSVLVGATAIGILLAIALAPILARKFGKRRVAVFVIIGGILGNAGPVLARLADLMPANGTRLLFGILFADSVATFCMAIITNILLTSMLNDVIEDVEVKTGYRSEGLLLAADSMFRKLVSGVGILVSGLMLTLIAFPQHAERGRVPADVVAKLAYAYIPMTFFYLLAIFFLYFYRIDRDVHERNLRILGRGGAASRAEADGETLGLQQNQTPV